MPPDPYAPSEQLPGPEPPRQGRKASGEIHVYVNAVLAIVGSVVTLLAVVSALTRLGDVPARSNPAYSAGYRVGGLLLLGIEVALLGLGTTAAYGLLARRTWAAKVTFFYWLAGFFTCFLTLPAIYGVFSTSRPAFRAFFERDDGQRRQ